jgi:hypothetical protein
LIAVKISDNRSFLSALFTRPVFDTFILGEAQITTYTTFRIDGTWHPSYFSEIPGRPSAAVPQSSRQDPADRKLPTAGQVSEYLSAGSGQPVEASEKGHLRAQEPSWARIRPIVRAIVSGKHSPLSFRIILKMPDKGIQSILTSGGLSVRVEDVNGLFLNITYQNEEILCTSGVSLKTFTLDKSLDKIWDDMMLRFFAARSIAVELQ